MMRMRGSQAQSFGPHPVRVAAESAGRMALQVVRNVKALLRQASWKQRGLLALAVASPLIAAGWFALHQRSQVIADAHESAQRSVLALEQHAANVVDAHALILRQLDILTHGRSSDQIRNDELLKITIAGFSRELAQVAGIGITDAAGSLITNSFSTRADGLSVADRDYFVAHVRGAPVGIFVGEAFTGRASNRRQFALSIRRTLPGGEFGGVIFTTVPLEHFTAFWRGFTPSGGHLIPMVRPDGALIVRYPRTDSPPYLDANGPFVSRLTRWRKGVYTAVSQVDGIERINAYSQVKDYPLFISYSVDTRTVLETWRSQAFGFSVIAVLVTGLLASLWVVAMRQSHAQRLSAMKWEAAARALQAEVSRREQAEELMRLGAQRVSFGTQLIGIVSHDLRNPLNTISLTAAVIARRDALEPKDAQLLQRIQNASERATRLIRDLLDFTQARLGGRIPVHAQPMNFHELLQSVLAELEAAHPDRIQRLLEADDAHGEWDRDRLAQVIENLVVNALKYGVADAVVRVRTWSDESSLLLEVHNHGAPIAAEKMADIFEPLQRGAGVSQPNPDRSIGMGLFIVKHIVEAHGGSMSVDSTFARGTTFTVRLPRVGTDRRA
jgi:signal transduction histidine kinase